MAAIALNLLTWLVARYGPQAADGQPWSLRGNGALVVPFGLGPAIVGGVWVALVLRYRAAAMWSSLAIWAGLVGVAFVVAGVIALALFGSAAQRLSDWLSVVPIGWMVLAPLLASVLPVGRSQGQEPLFVHLAAGLIFPIVLVVGSFGAGLVVPPGS